MLNSKKRQLWGDRVKRWRSSELSLSEYAREIGVNVVTMRQWRRRIEDGWTPSGLGRKKTQQPRPCEYCGKSFTPQRSHARNCSSRCAVAKSVRRRRMVELSGSFHEASSEIAI